ncbi:hypothetical protein C8R43DRAFT_520188 [Mycena crocata]|nr:hypothetical protein C8R43DRAFT_520188 [Mycena crocata]
MGITGYNAPATRFFHPFHQPMSSTDVAILQNASYHARLLAAITELDYVPSALAQQDSYIASVVKEAMKTAAKIGVLSDKTEKERKEYEDLRDSTTRLITHKLTGRKGAFDARLSKEEREFIEAQELETHERKQLEMLEGMIAEAKTARVDLQKKAERHARSKHDLSQLYSQIFDGPTQAYPEDDRLESELQLVQGRYNEIQNVLNRESQALSLLRAADAALLSCKAQMAEALDASQWDILGGGAVNDALFERGALRTAQDNAMQAATYVQQAMLVSPQVQPVSQIHIAQGSFVSDVVFDNFFTDMAFHDKIKESSRNVAGVHVQVMNQIEAAKGRAAAVGADLSQAADALERTRGTLDAFRRFVFDKHVFGHGSGNSRSGTPPSSTAQPPPASTAGSSTHAERRGSPLPSQTAAHTPPPGPPPAHSASPAPRPGLPSHPAAARTSRPGLPSNPAASKMTTGSNRPPLPPNRPSDAAHAPPLGPPPGHPAVPSSYAPPSGSPPPPAYQPAPTTTADSSWPPSRPPLPANYPGHDTHAPDHAQSWGSPPPPGPHGRA